MFSQESNRACANGLRNQLVLLDMMEKDLVPGEEFKPKDTILETLAETEHLRWNAWHLMRGIRPWPLEDITDEDLQRLRKKSNDIANRLRNASIVDYAMLPKVDERLGHGLNHFQDNDRNLIKNMGMILCDDEPFVGENPLKKPKQ